ncbi:GNAT family N-acetyltransferase [Myceligenerans pegani]|uniref:GNAT family N-acetyltransferase n=1 Tax=Myceligenerans pegani TaxID=2776917 RepID=A0ABR9N6Q2_9MICO|nr:GNAT family N-acetyltransferase [Myceligenerans sp. TRM 65318]MBE1878886.1 GNAT family N-acetyltransferase [Myceligenerans sp. TRM 65318]MBE3021157.1 GNAT family N-acetyltransferase [Myceligenerans sp. TRM 65318]
MRERVAVEVRPAGAADLDAVAELAARGRDESPAGTQVAAGDHERLREQLSVLLAVDGHVLVAERAGRIVGVVLGRLVGPHLFVVRPVLYLDTVFVAPDARRRGVGHALLRAVASLAIENDCEEVYAAPVAGTRGVQRFLARLGFAPACGHRVAPTQTLLRRLAQDSPLAKEAEHHRRRPVRAGLEDLIARRRRARSAETGPLDLREVPAAAGTRPEHVAG